MQYGRCNAPRQRVRHDNRDRHSLQQGRTTTHVTYAGAAHRAIVYREAIKLANSRIIFSTRPHAMGNSCISLFRTSVLNATIKR